MRLLTNCGNMQYNTVTVSGKEDAHMIRRMLSVILCMALMLTVLVALPQEAEAAQSITLSEIETKMDAYISWLNASSKKYWNANVKEAALKAALDKGDFATGMTAYRCAGSSDNKTHSCNVTVNGKIGCTSNTFGGGKQCSGFARYLWYYLFGVTVTTTASSGSSWTYYDKVPTGGLQAGDYIFCKGHAFVVRKVDASGYVWAIHANGHSSSLPCMVEYARVFKDDQNYWKVSDFQSASGFRFLRYNNITICQHVYDNYGKCTKCGADYPIALTAVNKTYIAVKNDVPVRTSPYSPVAVKRYLSKGENVYVTYKGVNSRGNLWYKLNTGEWVYSGNLSYQPVTFGTIKFTRNSSTSVTARCTITYDKGYKPTKVGIRKGLSKSPMVSVDSDSVTHSKNPFDAWYDLKVSRGLKYYYQFYAVINGKTYYGNVQTYKTT